MPVPSIIDDIIAVVLALAMIVAMFFYARYEHIAAISAEAQTKQVIAVNKQNVSALAEIQKQYQAAQAASAQAAADKQQLADELAQIKQENSHAPNGNKAVSPVVGGTLLRLLVPSNDH